MNTITGLLESFEKLAYKFLLAILFFPKTILQIIVNPTWAPEYVKGELKQKESPFDEYMSPIVLLLVVALLPALIRNFLPTYQTVITAGPAPDEPADTRLMEFQAETETHFRSPDVYNQYTWNVQKIVYTPEGDRAAVNLYEETYNESTGNSVTRMGDSVEPVPVRLSGLTYKDQKWNLPTSSFYYTFDENTKEEEYDEYLVTYQIVSFYPDDVADNEGNKYFPDKITDVFDPDNSQFILETHAASQTIVVPVKTDKNQQVLIPDSKAKNTKGASLNVSDLLKKETTTFLALGLLFPPLLFALATKLYREPEISEAVLRESFYVQCYYFSPLSLAIWATYYARYFLTPDIFNYRASDAATTFIVMPSLLAVLWFIGVETHAIETQRPTKRWVAFLITAFCGLLIAAVGLFIFLFIQPNSSLPDMLRTKSIVAYPWIGILLLLLAGLGWARERMKSEQKIKARDLVLIGFSVLMVYGGLRVLGLVIDSFSFTETASLPYIPIVTAVPVTPAPFVQELVAATDLPAEAPPTEAPQPDASGFYTEEFDGDLSSWQSYTAMGDDAQVKRTVEDGRVVFHLSPSGGELPITYLYNNAFSYTDVRLDMLTTNIGNNANDVSLVCRFTGSSWYEFDVSNSGSYAIYAVDVDGTVQQGYNELTSGNSVSIKSGHSTNSYAAVCKGNELSLLVNGDLVATIQDTQFKFTEGNIGVGVTGRQVLPIDVSIDSLTTSQP